MIEGIPDLALRNQARMQNFETKELLVKAFQKIRLPSLKEEGKPFRRVQPSQKATMICQGASNAAQGAAAGGVVGDSRPAVGSSWRTCHYCKKEGHFKFTCPELARGRRTCFSCGQPGHLSKDCPTKKEVHNVDRQQAYEDEYFKIVEYRLYCGNGIEDVLKLDTLLDSGSPCSLIKLAHVSSNLIENANEFDGKFFGLNRSALSVLGKVRLDVTLNGKKSRNCELLIVPDHTMSSSIVLGRDLLRRFGLGLREVDGNVQSTERDEVSQIMAIDVSHPADPSHAMVVNPAVPIPMQE